MTLNKNTILLIILAGILGGAGYYNSHIADITAFQANNCFKKNDMVCAQDYYEKAFGAGYSDSKARDAYVNILINSPLDVRAQEKLVKFLDYGIEDDAKQKVEYFLYDLKKEIYKKYPQNYISQAVFNQKVLRWGKVPITYGFEASQGVPEYFEKEIENAFTEWEKATSHQILFIREDKNPNITVKFNVSSTADDDDQKFIVAYTTPTVVTGKLKNMVINFYLKDPQGEFYTENEAYNTALHEIAHALGFMGHSYDKNNIMYLTKDSISVMNNTREELTEADINTIKLLYKIKPEITNVSNSDGEYIPYLVFGNDVEVNVAKTKEAKNYIRKAPELPSGYIDLAESYVASQDYAKAIRSLEKALILADTDDTLGIIYYNLAVSYYYINHLPMALDYAKKAEEIKNTEDVHYLFAEIYTKQEDLPNAIKEYNNLIAKNPKNIEYTIALANIYVRERKYFAARKVLKNFMQKNPTERNNPRFNPYGIIKLGL